MDIILYNILVGICCAIVGYLFGSIPVAVFISNHYYHTNIREKGSGNTGATNVGRVLGRKAGVIVAILDILKSAAPIWICWAILTFVPFGGKTLLGFIPATGHDIFTDHILVYPAYWVACFGVSIGHCYPLFAHFKGGKGAASLLGFGLGTNWMYTVPSLLIFLAIMKKAKMMSFTILTTFLIYLTAIWTIVILTMTHVLPVWFYTFPGYGAGLRLDLTFAIVTTVCYIISVYRHKENIKRLIRGEERKINFFGSKS